jgi:hypothetical protein
MWFLTYFAFTSSLLTFFVYCEYNSIIELKIKARFRFSTSPLTIVLLNNSFLIGEWKLDMHRYSFFYLWCIFIFFFVCRIRYLLIARLLRLIRILMYVRSYQAFVATFLTLIPSLMPYLGTIFCVMCIYCSLGIQVHWMLCFLVILQLNSAVVDISVSIYAFW